MKRETKANILYRLGLSLWAMLTLVLCFVVVMLVNQLFESGRTPLQELMPAQQKPIETSPVATPLANTAGAQQIKLFFAASNGEGLAMENATIEFSPRTVENCRSALQALIAGPREGGTLLPVLPNAAKLRGLYLLENGELVVDFSSDLILSQSRVKSAGLESLMVYAIVHTVTGEALRGQDKAAVSQVRFLIEGAPPMENFPAHLDLSRPVKADQRWVQAASG